MKLGVLASTLLLALSTSASAAIVALNSGAGIGTNNIAGNNQNVEITVHPAWQQNGAGKWISYAQTGNGGSSPANVVVNPNTEAMLNAAPATAVFTHTFLLPFSVNTGQLQVWADDTARVVLNGNVLKLANPVQDGACAAGSIACEPAESSTFVFGSGAGKIALSAGLNTLEIHAYQRGGGPFGVLYQGSVTSVVPEPGFYGLLGLGLSGLYMTVRRRRTA